MWADCELTCQGKHTSCDVMPALSMSSAASDTRIWLLLLAALKAVTSRANCCQLKAPAHEHLSSPIGYASSSAEVATMQNADLACLKQC